MSAMLLALPFLFGASTSALAAPAPLAALVRSAAAQEPLAETSVGMRIRLEEIPIAGTALRAKPVADPGSARAIVRVLNVFPHGTSFRYNLEVMPFEAGTLDLREHLEREDGSGLDDLPAMTIEVGALLPGGVVEPNDLEIPTPGKVGGYKATAIALGVLWCLGLLALLFGGRRRRADRHEGCHGA